MGDTDRDRAGMKHEMKHRVTAAVLAMLLVRPVGLSNAAVVANALNDADRIAAANQFDGKVVAVIATYPAGDTYPAGSVAASGTVVNNEWILTSRHYVDDFIPIGATFSAVTGSNFKTSPGFTLSVKTIVKCPLPGTDLALMHLNGIMPNAINAVFASPVYGEMGYYVGYGILADMSDGSQVYSGDRRLFTAPTVSIGRLDFVSSFLSTSDSLSGHGWSWDSGGGVFNQFGQQTGTMLTQTGGIAFGYTGAQNLGNSDIQNWIYSTVAASVAATETPKITVSLTLTSAQLTFANLIPAREYRIMRSATLSAWQEAHRFTATGTTASWSEALSPEGRRFYRLEWNE